jgi:thiosulfate/3-mercaptopyruvate sulfurtransferase
VGGFANPEVLVDTDWVAGHLHDPGIRIIEVDEDTRAYDKGHIPRSIGWDWFEDLHAKPRRDYIDQTGMSELLERSGVGPDTTVVLYGGNNNWFAAYAYWLLCYLGFDRTKLLNGGRKRWELEGRELTTATPELEPTSLPALGPIRSELRAMRDDVLSRVGSVSFVDVRSPEEFRGEMMAPAHLPQESAMVAGHIPGAVNVPWSRAANEDGTFKSAEDLQDLYSAAGVDDDSPVIAYCRIGERSAHTWFVLHELLGHSHVANYDGSWTEYGSLVAVPVEW